MSRPITHSTWLDGKESNHLFWHVSTVCQLAFKWVLTFFSNIKIKKDTQQWAYRFSASVKKHLLLQWYLQHFHMHTLTHTHTYSPSLCITMLLLCPELCPGTAQSYQLHTTSRFFWGPSVVHSNTSQRLAVLSSLLCLSFTHTPWHIHTQIPPPSHYLQSWQREKLLSAGLFHSEVVAHQRRSRSGGWSCEGAGGGGRGREMGTMNGLDSPFGKGARRLKMTKSQSDEENSCFRLWCSCYHHSDNCAGENMPPVIPVSIHPHLKATHWVAEVLLWVKECVILMTTSPSVFDGLLLSFWPPPPAPLPLCHSLPSPVSLSAPAPSLCPRWLPDEEELMPEFILELRLLPASLGSSAQLWGGGACCFKGAANHTAPPLLSSPLCCCQHFLSISSHSAYLAFVCVFVEDVISLKSTWSLPLLATKQSLGTKCPQMLGCYIINTQSRLAFDDLI